MKFLTIFSKFIFLGICLITLIAGISASNRGLGLARADSCDPNGGIDPNTWTYIVDACDPSNPGSKGQQWQCDGIVKYSNDVSDPSCGGYQPPAAPSSGQWACQTNASLCTSVNEQYCENMGAGSATMWKTGGACDPSNGMHDSNGCIFLFQNVRSFTGQNCQDVQVAPVTPAAPAPPAQPAVPAAPAAPVTCYVCDNTGYADGLGRWRPGGGCSASMPQCQANNSSTFGGCLGASEGGICTTSTITLACNSVPNCGSWNTPANTCSTNNSTQTCTYTQLNGSTNCTPVQYTNYNTIPNCNSGYSCINGICQTSTIYDCTDGASCGSWNTPSNTCSTNNSTRTCTLTTLNGSTNCRNVQRTEYNTTNNCQSGYNCTNGSCQSTTITCPSGTTLVNGQCQGTVTCPSGSSLVNGICVGQGGVIYATQQPQVVLAAAGAAGNVGIGTTVVTAATVLPKTGLPALAWAAAAFIPAGFRIKKFGRGIEADDGNPNYLWENREYKRS